MVQSLTFIDCSSCGKRIRSNALKCHHCQQENVPDSGGGSSATMKKSESKSQYYNADSHMALESGGYDQDADDFDYENYLAEEFPDHTKQNRKPPVKRWVWITAWVLVFATLLPYLYYAVLLTR
ncbi:MAG: hypothetical protein SFV81_03425 [Pirellulaceae bacterium]|nr:hypothetical protein [Pirellulaceae bacterium]